MGNGWYIIRGYMYSYRVVFGTSRPQYDPYSEIDRYRNSRHTFLVKSAEVSVQVTKRAIEELKKRNILGGYQGL